MTDPLSHLVQDLRPVVARPAGVTAAAWLVFAAVTPVVLTVIGLGLRGNFEVIGGDATFWMGLVALAGVIFTAARLGLTLAHPGARVSPAMRFSPYAALVLYGVFALMHQEAEAAGTFRDGLDPAGVGCCLGIAGLSILPGVVLLFVLKKLAVVEPLAVATALGLAMGAAGAIGIAFHCESSNAGHLVVFHGGAMVALGLILRPFARQLLRW